MTDIVKVGSLLGAAAGGAIGGPAGALVGSASGGLLAALLNSADVSAAGLAAGLPAGDLKQMAQFATGRLRYEERQHLQDELQLAAAYAFRNAVLDIGSADAFGKAWHKRNLDPGPNVSFPFSLLEQKKRADLATQARECLRALHKQAPRLVTGSTAAEWYVAAAGDERDLRAGFHAHAIAPWLADYGELTGALRDLGAVYDLDAHLARTLFPRLQAHLGAYLEQKPEAWRAFSREMWRSMQMATSWGQPQPDLTQALADLTRNSDEQLANLAAWLREAGEQAAARDERLEASLLDLDISLDRLHVHVTAEHAETRKHVDQAVETIVSRLRAAADERRAAALRETARSYHAAVERAYRRHKFQGIAQFRDLVELPLVDFYVELGLLPWQRGRRADEEQDALLAADMEERMAAFESRLAERADNKLGDFQRLVIVGDPGAGKTMTLRYVALTLAQGMGEEKLGLPGPLLPVLVRLADYAPQAMTMALDRFLMQRADAEYGGKAAGIDDLIRMTFREGGCMVLLDGLDEIEEETETGLLLRERVIERVNEFAADWCDDNSGNRLITTSRKEGYQPQELAAFDHVELSPLRPPDEIEAFLLRWYTAYEQGRDPELSIDDAGARARVFVDDMLPRILDWPSVRHLATNPLMLTVLVLVFENVGQIPDRRAKLYHICAQTLVQSWRAAQTRGKSPLLKQLGESRVFSILSRLAYWLHENRPGGTAPETEWEQQLLAILEDEQADGADAADLVRSFMSHARYESGLLAERGLGRIGFFHLTLEEYLTGYAIAHAAQEEQHRMVRAHWEDPRWREPLLLAVGELSVVMNFVEGTQDFLNRLLDLEPTDPADRGRQVVLAGRALLDAGVENVPRATAQRIMTLLRKTMQNVDPHSDRPRVARPLQPIVRFNAGEVLDSLGWLPDDLNRWQRCAGCADDGRDLLVMTYPLTNAQFELFIKAGGYEEPELWGGLESDDWGWRNEPPAYRGVGPVSQPLFWRDSRFGRDRDGFPVVGVSWYEARAYGRWVTRLLGQARANEDLSPAEQQLLADLLISGAVKVVLPTEEEWVRIAGGAEDGRYPWDRTGQVTEAVETVICLANVEESKIRRTTPVAMYPGGCAANGVADLAGNVWEWTDSWYDEARGARVLRGGSWSDVSTRACIAARYWFYPRSSDHYLFGFRLVSPIGSGS